ALDDDHVLVGLQAEGRRPLDLGRIVDVDALVHHDGVLGVGQGEDRHQGILAAARALAGRGDARPGARAALGDGEVDHADAGRPGTSGTGAPCSGPAIAISLTPGGALSAALRISIGCTPIDTEMARGSWRASRAS